MSEKQLKTNAENFKSEDVAPTRYAQWVWDYDLGAWACTKCKAKPETHWEKERGNPYNWPGSKYCSNCGAKMRVKYAPADPFNWNGYKER